MIDLRMNLKLVIVAACSVFVVSIICHWGLRPSTSVQSLLKTMPQKDREQLADFFEELIIEQCFSYAIFGDKPVSSAEYFVCPLLTNLLLENNMDVVLREGMKVWNKHNKKFCLKDYIINFHTEHNVRSIYLINKPAFIAQVTQHINSFREILGSEVTAKSLLAKLETGDISLPTLLHNHEGLLGIVYGFGKQNACNFQRYVDLDYALYGSPKIPFKAHYDEDLLGLTSAEKVSRHLARQENTYRKNPGKIAPSSDFQDLIQEYQYLQSKLQVMHVSFAFQRFSSPGFRADPDSEETKQILDSFKRTRESLAQIYAHGDFLEITLNRLTGQ
jgi:hypothetical protein